MALPEIGVKAVVEGLSSFNKAIDTINDKIKQTGKTTEGATKDMNPINKALENVGLSMKDVQGKVKDLLAQAGPLGSFLSGFVDKIAAIPLPVAAAVAGIALLTKAFIDLGLRGASLIGLAQTFDNVASSVGVSSQQLLKDLRTASAGTISDFGLIEKANIALSGATGVLGQELGKNLPKLLEIARVQARATGKDIDYIFGSLVEGIRKSSPLRIDNAQLIIKTSKAEQEYAASIGKTVEQLTIEEKGVAILNATLESGAAALAQAGNVQETNAEKLSRIQATLTNVADGFAVAVQPAFGVVLDAVQKVLNIFQQLGNAVAPIFGGIVSIIANVFGTIVDIVTSIVQPIVDTISQIAPYIALAFQVVANVIGGIGKIISDIVGGIVRFLNDVSKNFFGLDLSNLPKRLFEGAAAAFGSFANGIIATANKLIFPAVISIAKFIADFLIGFSPPKEGPLSQIDKGGANVMQSWLDGFTGVSLDPITQVTKEVNEALGSVGKLSLGAVNKRLASLDKALLPFQNRLDIVKSTFDSISEPAKQALEAIDRQTAELQDKLAQGDPQAAERLRVLDLQRDAIQKQVDTQQGLVDRAQIQLALAKAQQAPERTLLTIRQAQLQALAKAQPKVKETAAGRIPTEKVGTGSAPAPTAPGGAGVSAPGVEMPSVLDLIGGQGAVNEAAQGLTDAFMGAIDETGLNEFAQNSLDLGAQLDRIKTADLGKTITDKFSGITAAFDPNNPDSISAKVGGFIGTLTGNAETKGSIASFFKNLPDNIQNAVTALSGSAETPGSIASFFSDIPGNVSSLFSNLTGTSENPDSLAYLFAHLPDSINAAVPSIKDGLSGAFNLLFDKDTPGSPINALLTTITALTGNSETSDSIAALFAKLPQNVSDAASNLFTDLQTNVFDPVEHFLTGTGEGTMNDILSQFVKMFEDMPANLVEALKNLGGMVYNSVVVPIINVLNTGIGAVEGLIRSVAKGVAQILSDIIGGFDNAEIAGTNLGGLVPQGVRDLQANLAGAGQNFTIGRISTALPDFLAPPGGATGGLFSSGLMRVGERGEELIYNASKVGVIPNALTSVLTDLSSILAQPQPMPVMGGNTYNDSTSSMTNNFYGVNGASDVMRRFSQMRARS